MSKIKIFVAAALIGLPMFSLNAAELQIPKDAAPVMPDSRPTTVSGNCIYFAGWWICL